MRSGKLLMAAIFSLAAFIAKGQDISLKGKVADKGDNSAVVGATVKLVSARDSSQSKMVVTDKAGNFTFNNLNAGGYRIQISFTGYEKVEQRVNLQASNITPLSFNIAKVATDLGDVTVVAKAAPARQKGDTTEYSAGQFKVNPDATAEDMIKKLPGVTVGKDGTVTAMGEQVRKVTVDGKEFFGDDATAALKNLPASVIDKIQVFDKLSDQAQLTGFDDGNSVKTVNIVTKSGIKNGQFGRIYAGMGTDSRYSAGGNVSFFKGDRRISLVANFNNVNQQNFASQDLLGVTSTGGGGNRGGGRGGGGFGGGDNFNVGQSSGISKTNALGINFSNVYNKKLTLTGSYFFNNSRNNNESVINTETFGDPKNRFSIQRSTSATDNTNHRLNLRLEYRIDSSNSLFIIPSVSFQNNKSSGFSSQNIWEGIADSVSNSITPKSISDRNGFNIRNNILYRHSFAKRGRTLSLGFNTTFTKNDGETTTDSRYRFYDSLGVFAYDSLQNRFIDNNTNGHTIGGNIAYTEPIGKKGQLQIDYNLSVQKNKADQQNFSYDGVKYSVFDTSLSNRFDNTITTNNVGINYRLGQSRDEQLSFGVNFQASKLQSERIFPTRSSVDQTFANVLPNLMWRKKLNANVNVRVFYRASVNFPSVTQLQDVVNNSNPLYVSSGNPDLKQSYTHFLSGRYAYTNSKTSKSFFANLFLQTASNYISNATYFLRKRDTIINKVYLDTNTQFTKPVNLDGYRSLRTFFSYSMPLKFIKSTFNVNAGFSYSRLPGLVDYQNTFTNSFSYNGGIVLASNISEYVDFNLSYNANFSNSKTNNSNNTTTRFLNQAIGAQVNLLNKKGWFIQNDVSGNIYSGDLDQRFWLWNAAIGKKFLKNKAAELKLSVFDLLKQNQSIIRTVTGTEVTDAQTKVLQQYFMLTFTYSLKNFGVANASNNQNRGDRQFGPGGGGGNRPF